ncbi:hypothetical protein SO694_00060158 [Aureococcus anophagefferens]|uniref:Uncharacterized protein n=1 Tax=Aureococcus anophagefferens TaxID=44056 RepID=A0ABR1FR87_AURAN
MWNAIVAIAAVLGVAYAQVDLDGVDLVKMQRSLNGMTHFRDAPVVRDVFARDVQCYDLLFRNNAGRSMFGWVTLANEKLMEDDWSCALTLMVQLHRETRRARDAARRENGSASTEAAWHYVNASFSLAMLYTNPGVVTTLSDESPVHVARGEKLLWHVLEVVAADGLLGEDDASVRYMVDVAENVFAGADKARALTPVREDGAASYVERPAYWGEADEFADCGDPISTARVGMLYALFGDHLLAENLRRSTDLNYLRKIFTAVAISRRRRYDTLVSLDDDILLAPPAYLALLQHAPFGVRGPDAPCAMVTPTVSTGIPTAELFAADFLPAASAAALEACYVETIRRWPRLFGDPDFSLADETLERLEGPWPSAEAWDPAWWRAKLWDKAANFLYENVRSYGLGVHPVRVNETCAALAFAATLPLVPAHFGASAADDRLALARARLEVGGPRAYPYLANSVWATSPDRLVDALLRVDLATGGHPFDEAAMSTLFLHERNESLRGSTRRPTARSSCGRASATTTGPS